MSLERIGSLTQIDQRLSLRTRSTSTSQKSEKCTSDKKSPTVLSDRDGHGLSPL